MKYVMGNILNCFGLKVLGNVLRKRNLDNFL